MDEGQSPDSPGSSANWEPADRVLYSWLGESTGIIVGKLEAMRRQDPDLAAAVQSRFDRLRPFGMQVGEIGAANEPRPGSMFGDFRILRLLGVGGMGTVYLAEQTALARRVALKVIRSDRLRDPASRDRFRREARAVADLRDPGICAVLDVGEVDGAPYLAMQYIEGETLADRLASQRSVPERRAWSDSVPSTAAEICGVLQLIEKVGRSLHIAHEAGVVHRDVKPANVMIDRHGMPVLLDFGLAHVASVASDMTLTMSGDLLGTPAYMSPEQVQPKDRVIDRRADVYSLAVTLFECLTHERPFRGSTPAALYECILRDPTPDPRRHNPRLPADIGAVLAKAMEKDPGRRYATAAAFADELVRLERHEPVQARRVRFVGRSMRWAQRYPVAAALLLVLALGLSTVVWLLLLQSRTARSFRAAALVSASIDASRVNPTRGLLLACAAAEDDPGPMTLSQVEQAWMACADVKLVEAGTHGVWGAAFSPDGTRIVTRGADFVARLLDGDGKLVADLGGGDKIWAVAFSPRSDRGLFLLGRADGTVQVFDRDGARAGGFHNPKTMGAACFTADGTGIVTGSDDGAARLWRLDGELVRQFEAPPGSDVVRFAGIGRVEVRDHWLLTSDYLGFATVHDLDSGKVRSRLQHTGGPLREASFCPKPSVDVPLVLIVSRYGDPWLWDPGDARPPLVLAGHHMEVWRGVWSPDGERIVTCGFDHDPYLWGADGKLLGRLHGAETGVWDATFDREGRILTASGDGAARLYDREGTLLLTLRGHAASVDTVAFSPDGRRALTGSQDDSIGLWPLDRAASILAGNAADVLAAEPLADGRAVTSTLDGSVFLWTPGGPRRCLIPGKGRALSFLSVAEDSSFLCGGAVGVVHSFDATGSQTGSIAFADSICNAWPAPDGKLVVVTFGWNADTPLVCVCERKGDKWEQVNSVPFKGLGRLACCHCDSDCNQLVLAWPSGDFVRLRRSGITWTEQSRGKFGGANTYNVALSADGARTLVCQSDGSARILQDGRPAIVLRAQDGQISTGIFSPRGDRVLTTSRDGTAALWTNDGELVRVVHVDAGPAHTGMFTPDGQRILIGYADGTARYFFVDTTDLTAAAHAALHRDFTDEERARYATLLAH